MAKHRRAGRCTGARRARMRGAWRGEANTFPGLSSIRKRTDAGANGPVTYRYYYLYSRRPRRLAFLANTDSLFSMATEAALSSIRTSLARWKPLELTRSARVLPFGVSALDAALPDGGLLLGGVTELQVRGASGIATSFALAACRAAQQFGREQGRQKDGNQLAQRSPPRSDQLAQRSPPRGDQLAQRSSPRGDQLQSGVWCAFIDPSASLFAPGAARLGVDLSHLLVARPSADALERAAVRIAETNLMAVLVVDLRCSMPQGSMKSSLTPSSSLNEHSWQRTVRRLSLAIKSSSSSVLLITQAEQFQSLPLPTSQRLELTRRSQTSFELKVAKERTGRISSPRLLPCSLFDLSHFDPSVFASHEVEASRGANDKEHHQGPELTALTRKVS